MIAAITGASGFLGSGISRAFVARGYDVRAVGRSGRAADTAAVMVDLCDTSSVVGALSGCDILVHAAGRCTPANTVSLSDDLASIEVRSGLSVFEAAVQAGVRKLVFISSGGTVYGAAPASQPLDETTPTHPTSRYGALKSHLEDALRMFTRRGDIEHAIARLSNPYGRGQLNRRDQGLIATVIARAMRKQVVEVWGDGSAVRDYIYVDDACDGVVSAAMLDGSGTFNVGSGIGRRTRDVVNDIAAKLGVEIELFYRTDKPSGVPYNVLNHDKLSALSGWQPQVEWESGMKRTIAWWRASNADRLGGLPS